ncbi:transcriptional regulator [Haemophilus influenzae biotype aegyptius]|uniref:type II toxin-antitoxin system HicB family antitoxin n=1 Tax=Haemophilus influenzae TaxID=727 RepID=UPI0001F3691A|nr:type II toxin-antitoxin system HicB family antitoxin [Haemophilus influenzae]QEQ62663.1 type II toxin-antitoxin system HicB family antitoxin [Haemophilus influenzae biotype aegyptius]QEQ63621.1 type II toxin-antitoxin system HicB family antitoxin [Haemophilus influenzae biotype aegyptius]QEQ66228.1 type II toxin-antitoxin system HicB family antitoxin [Haemophilus influenzae biotype aegyptius]TMQ39249.1 transcriptional regulator [Haemophilus influenzae biotype aegyptius]TMQ40303.1 transcript
MFYPATFTPAEEGGYVVTFADLPEAITQGDTIEEAQEMAEDVLISCVEIYFDEERPFPLARACDSDETAVFMPDSVYAKVLLHNAMLAENVSKAQLARLTYIRPPEIQRILAPRHTTKIDTIAKALLGLGKQLQLSVV